MKIDLSLVDDTIKRQLPISLQINNSIIDLYDLPLSVQKLFVTNNVKPHNEVSYFPSNTIDFKFEKSNYNDVKIFTSRREVLIEYIKNYFSTLRGNYPFDPTFGNELKKYLHVKNSTLKQTLLDSELNTISEVISDSFRETVRIIGITKIPINKLDHVEYQLSIRCQVDSDEVIFNIV